MSHSTEQIGAKKSYRSIGWLCQRTGYSRKHLNRLADQGSIPGSQPRATSRSHWRFEVGSELRKFVQELVYKAKQLTAEPKPVRRYVRETVLAPLTPPRNKFAAAVRQLKGAQDAYVLNLACLMEQEEARVGAADTNEILREEGVASSDVERVKALLSLPTKVRQIARGLGDEHAIAVVRAKRLTMSARTRWLQKAKKHGLTAYELQKSIRQNRVVTMKDLHEQSGRNSGILTIEGISYELETWSKRGKLDGRIKGLDHEQKQMLSEELQRMEQYISDVKVEAQLSTRKVLSSGF